NPSELAENFKSTDVVDPHTVKITMVDKTQPLLNLLVSPTFVILDSKVVLEHGGDSSRDASTKDKASEWLNQNSAGTGPYMLTRWERNSQIELKQNSNYWRKPAGFERVVIQHIPESTSQVLALKRGDIDA